MTQDHPRSISPYLAFANLLHSSLSTTVSKCIPHTDSRHPKIPKKTLTTEHTSHPLYIPSPDSHANPDKPGNQILVTATLEMNEKKCSINYLAIQDHPRFVFTSPVYRPLFLAINFLTISCKGRRMTRRDTKEPKKSWLEESLFHTRP